MKRPPQYKLCRSCQRRRALFRAPGWATLKWDKRHDLCRQCWRTMMNSESSRRLNGGDKEGNSSETH